jgi:hypothetical protein
MGNKVSVRVYKIDITNSRGESGQGVALSTHSIHRQGLTKEQSYISTPLLSLHGL